MSRAAPRAPQPKARTQRAIEAATVTTLQRKRRLQQVQRNIAEAEGTQRQEVAVAATAQALNRDNQAAATGATATPSPPTRQHGVNSRWERRGDAAFLEGRVQFMVSSPREVFSAALGGSPFF